VKRALVAALCVGALASCNFEGALETYCLDNPVCLDGGANDAGSRDGGPGDSGVGVARVTGLGLQFLEPDNQVCGHVTPLVVTTVTEDGGEAEPLSLEFESTGVVQRLQDGGVTSSAAWADGGDYRVFTPGTHQVRVIGTRRDGSTVMSRQEQRRCRGKLHLRPGGPYTPFTCIPLTVELVGEANSDRIDVNGQRVQLWSGGSPMLVSPGEGCSGFPTTDLTITNFVVRASRRDEFPLELKAVMLDAGVDDSLLARWTPMPLEARLALVDGGGERAVDHQFAFTDGGARALEPGVCTPLSLSWRHLVQAPGFIATATQGGDVFPFHVSASGGVALFSDQGCGANVTGRLLADGGVARVRLFARWDAGPGEVQVRYADGGGTHVWGVTP